MQLKISIGLEEPMVLPINYQHIFQAVIYQALSIMPDYSDFLHDGGFVRGQRKYKMYQYSMLEGKYRIENKKIIFYDQVVFEIRSPEPLFIRLIANAFWITGMRVGENQYSNIQMELGDNTVEKNQIEIQMKTPITVYETDIQSKEKVYYTPYDERFYELIAENFYRKYEAFYGVAPQTDIQMRLLDGINPKKFVTKFKRSYITGWYGKFEVSGERKYLDFLYQTGLGSKNSQGFGMFELL